MIMLSKRLNSLKRQVLATAGIALSFAVLTAEPVDASSFNLHFSRKGNDLRTEYFTVNEDESLDKYTRSRHKRNHQFFGGKQRNKWGFETEKHQIRDPLFTQNRKNKNGKKPITVRLKLENGNWQFNDDGSKRRKYKISKKHPKSAPEPLTILGSATAIGFGAALKRKHSKKQQKGMIEA
ncbi:MAG: PEP-CTERM sorting domain-containing protein [Symploca sp. SIO2E9]|nr:PEP-CTERM sorting domain-containing protein [Symploca sp. SIO2E9]